ncbi:patatin family protein [Wenyingzhuangia sp. 2_MG-2023]|uniref:patatin-like phospholipase family protein n=1 Tax=Wenyingzhuangia sp. 2_MG-2023 TaxID=3062639 RepID=UPI0026E3EBCA|nr:patatin-like phospholipase family protein [Wenyingzhuangia sp. 2_MG-2023]MDO6738870.1 patatin-like phospholipase family protein [Wenyingzhuangia sp. 2_MG-2023]MDO6803612.1 patatin-like phospholipase family protein [Wenyingzhuangia sp. 1_MG-2023]
MRALVISGGGSKGAFAGGVAEFLMTQKSKEYDMLLGTSTGSLMISHLALGRIKRLKDLYTSVDQNTIFSNCPFVVKGKRGAKTVSINHLKVLWNLIRKRKTFGESKNLRKLLYTTIDDEFFAELQATEKELVVAVSNLTLGKIEYKSIKECDRKQYCDWIWASCNYVPFMSLYEKDSFQYADGGFGALVPIKEAINRGASEVDVIILDTEVRMIANIAAKNPFSLISDVIDFTLEQVSKHNVTIGKLAAQYKNVQLNLYYTPTILTSNSLVFDKELMTEWWQQGYHYAKEKHETTEMSTLKFADK